jgi:hypothetical protein
MSGGRHVGWLPCRVAAMSGGRHVGWLPCRMAATSGGCHVEWPPCRVAAKRLFLSRYCDDYDEIQTLINSLVYFTVLVVYRTIMDSSFPLIVGVAVSAQRNP